MEKRIIKNKTVYGISFDAVPVSGLIVEFCKIARIFFNANYEIYLDLGYETKADKENFFKPYLDETRYIPSWINLIKISGLDHIEGYNQEFVSGVLQDVISSRTKKINPALRENILRITREISECILATWYRTGVSFVIIENGTLPENIMFTMALYRSIEIYGQENNLGKYVLWRDQDLMWSSETTSKKYGEFPYIYVPKPRKSPYIQYIVQHTYNYDRMLEWSPNIKLDILSNTFSFKKAGITWSNTNFRRDFHIPEDAFLISRCTRIIPQKRIDREIYCISELHTLLKKNKVKRDIYLFISGDMNENRQESRRLKAYAYELGISKYVIFGGILLSFEENYQDKTLFTEYSIKDLLAHTDINSFLTSYDYESFGNPVGESIASGVPFLTTSYNVYDVVYGAKGFRGLIFPVTQDNDGYPDIRFIREIYHYLVDRKRRKSDCDYNFCLGKQFLSSEYAEKKMKQFFPDYFTKQKEEYTLSGRRIIT
ncbi:MAG: glycosyltransferase [Spirochaetales bacterium]|nr:glycosyltransferase [Spirochaetales bacterium]